MSYDQAESNSPTEDIRDNDTNLHRMPDEIAAMTSLEELENATKEAMGPLMDYMAEQFRANTVAGLLEGSYLAESYIALAQFGPWIAVGKLDYELALSLDWNGWDSPLLRRIARLPLSQQARLKRTREAAVVVRRDDDYAIESIALHDLSEDQMQQLIGPTSIRSEMEQIEYLEASGGQRLPGERVESADMVGDGKNEIVTWGSILFGIEQLMTPKEKCTFKAAAERQGLVPWAHLRAILCESGVFDSTDDDAEDPPHPQSWA